MNRKLPFFCFLALFIALFLEITLFNYTHYATLFTKEHFSIVYNKQEQKFNHNFKSGYWRYDGVFENGSLLFPEAKGSLSFPNLNAEIASIYIEPVFLGKNVFPTENVQHVKVIWADEESSKRIIDVSIIKGLDFSNYITIAPRGKVSNLTIAFLENNIAIKQVELNKKIPMAVMPIRLLIVFGVSLLLLCLRNAELRKKISNFCFDYLCDKVNFRQRVGFAMLVCSMLAFNFLGSYSTCYGFNDNKGFARGLKMYSHHMTDALLKKQLHLDIEVPQALLEAEKPYDREYRMQHGIYLINTEDAFDFTYYKGKYYSYFGMLPVIILFAPYKLLTGNYLPTSMGVFLFASIATMLLMLLWKQIVQIYLKKLPYFFFLIGGAALYAFSLIPIKLLIVGYHSIPQYSGLAFVLLGVIMLLRAREKLSVKFILVSSLSFALAVACRPTALFWSLLIPVMLWDKKNDCKYRHLLAIIIPFVIVGSVLAWYNYARFGSPFEFGMVYQIEVMNLGMVSQTSFVGKIYIIVKTLLLMLLNPPNLDIAFPFVSAKLSNTPLATISFFPQYGPVVGIFCFPIMWFLFYAGKVNVLRNFIFAGIFISTLNIVLLAFTAIQWRYAMDFSWIIAIGALICAFQLQEKEVAVRKIILKTFYSCCGITIVLVFFLAISYRIYLGGNAIGIVLDPKIHYYLARTFGVICNVP